MLLVIDAGNTNTVMAIHDGHGWVGRWRISTDAQRTSDEYAVWLLTLLQHAGLRREGVSAAVIGTVVPAALYDLRRMCRDWFEVEPLIANAGLDWGFEIRIPNPNEVGADRLLNTLAAHTNYGGPAVLIDFGTATTFDVMDRDGAYLGGVIAPGINLSIEALHRAAAAGVTHLDVYSDSELLVKQMRGEYKVKNADLKVLVDEAKQLMISFGDVRFEHVRREQNKRADELCNLALDGKPIKKSVESDLASPSAELTNAAMKVLIRHVDLDIAEAIWRDLWKTIRPKS